MEVWKRLLAFAEVFQTSWWHGDFSSRRLVAAARLPDRLGQTGREPESIHRSVLDRDSVKSVARPPALDKDAEDMGEAHSFTWHGTGQNLLEARKSRRRRTG